MSPKLPTCLSSAFCVPVQGTKLPLELFNKVFQNPMGQRPLLMDKFNHWILIWMFIGRTLLDPMLGLDVARMDLCPHSIRSWHPLWYLGHLPAHGVPFMAYGIALSLNWETNLPLQFPLLSPTPAPNRKSPRKKGWLTPNLWLPVSRSLGNRSIKAFSGGRRRDAAMKPHGTCVENGLSRSPARV